NLQTEQTEYEAPKTETAWSRIRKALGPIAVVGVVVAKFFAKLKFILLPLLKFLPILLKSGGTLLLMIWVYTQLWGWQFALGFVLRLCYLSSVGMLGGGRIVASLARWLWVPGLALLLWFAWRYPNFMICLIVILSWPRIYALFPKRAVEEQRYYEVTSCLL